jgi:hypothetical protein
MMPGRKVTRATFSIERRYDVAPAWRGAGSFVRSALAVDPARRL